MSNPFLALGVSEDLIKGLEELGIRSPTQIQRDAIPPLLENGRDFVAQAQTGTGKTAAFGLPLLMKVDSAQKEIQGLIIAPTRELAKQIGKQLFRYTKYSAKIFVEVLSGGDPIDRQCAALRRPTHIVVAIIALTPNRKGTWLFSATFPQAIDALVERHISEKAPFIKVEPSRVVNRNITHQFSICDRADKDDYIARFLKACDEDRGLIFCRTKAGATTLGRKLTERGFKVEVLQGDLTQQERDKVMRAFKKERVQFLIATDVAARGIDVANLAFVIHHRLPDQSEYYTHRSGRTARAGKKGLSLALIEPQERRRLQRFADELNLRFEEV